MIKKGFKLLTAASKKLFSYTQYAKSRAVRYIQGKKTVPKKDNGPLAVFPTMKSLRDFRQYKGPDDRIYTCEYEESSETLLWYLNKQGIKISYDPQSNTAFAKWVVIKERIKC